MENFLLSKKNIDNQCANLLRLTSLPSSTNNVKVCRDYLIRHNKELITQYANHKPEKMSVPEYANRLSTKSIRDCARIIVAHSGSQNTANTKQKQPVRGDKFAGVNETAGGFAPIQNGDGGYITATGEMGDRMELRGGGGMLQPPKDDLERMAMERNNGYTNPHKPTNKMEYDQMMQPAKPTEIDFSLDNGNRSNRNVTNQQSNNGPQMDSLLGNATSGTQFEGFSGDFGGMSAINGITTSGQTLGSGSDASLNPSDAKALMARLESERANMMSPSTQPPPVANFNPMNSPNPHQLPPQLQSVGTSLHAEQQRAQMPQQMPQQYQQYQQPMQQQIPQQIPQQYQQPMQPQYQQQRMPQQYQQPMQQQIPQQYQQQRMPQQYPQHIIQQQFQQQKYIPQQMNGTAIHQLATPNSQQQNFFGKSPSIARGDLMRNLALNVIQTGNLDQTIIQDMTSTDIQELMELINVYTPKEQVLEEKKEPQISIQPEKVEKKLKKKHSQIKHRVQPEVDSKNSCYAGVVSTNLIDMEIEEVKQPILSNISVNNTESLLCKFDIIQPEIKIVDNTVSDIISQLIETQISSNKINTNSSYDENTTNKCLSLNSDSYSCSDLLSITPNSLLSVNSTSKQLLDDTEESFDLLDEVEESFPSNIIEINGSDYVDSEFYNNFLITLPTKLDNVNAIEILESDISVNNNNINNWNNELVVILNEREKKFIIPSKSYSIEELVQVINSLFQSDIICELRSDKYMQFTSQVQNSSFVLISTKRSILHELGFVDSRYEGSKQYVSDNRISLSEKMNMVVHIIYNRDKKTKSKFELPIKDNTFIKLDKTIQKLENIIIKIKQQHNHLADLNDVSPQMTIKFHTS